MQELKDRRGTFYIFQAGYDDDAGKDQEFNLVSTLSNHHQVIILPSGDYIKMPKNGFFLVKIYFF